MHGDIPDNITVLDGKLYLIDFETYIDYKDDEFQMFLAIVGLYYGLSPKEVWRIQQERRRLSS